MGDHAFIIGGEQRAVVLPSLRTAAKDHFGANQKKAKGYLSWCIAEIDFGRRLCKDITSMKICSAHLYHRYASII